jgi:hypothetical protein
MFINDARLRVTKDHRRITSKHINTEGKKLRSTQVVVRCPFEILSPRQPHDIIEVWSSSKIFFISIISDTWVLGFIGFADLLGFVC